MDEQDTTTGTTPAPDQALSFLASLKERRQEILEEQTLDLPVPRWTDPEIVVRYKPVEHTMIRNGQARVDKAPKADKARVEVDANTDLLIRACVGVIAKVDGREYSLRPGDPHGEPTVFDTDLAANLGLDDRATARAIVRALYITEGDILAASSKVVEFSGYREAEADSRVEGE